MWLGQSDGVIVVVEGPSASGKTTWLKRHVAPEQTIPEHGGIEVPAGHDDEVAQFWTSLNASRWASAVASEASTGLAFCDGDPLKLSYDYCRARIGALPWDQFTAGVGACTTAIREGQLGIADVIFCSIPDVDTLDARRQADSNRRRSNFAVNRLLGPALRDWYGTLNRINPGRVEWAFPIAVPDRVPLERYDVELFATWMAELPGRPRTIR